MYLHRAVGYCSYTCSLHQINPTSCPEYPCAPNSAPSCVMDVLCHLLHHQTGILKKDWVLPALDFDQADLQAVKNFRNSQFLWVLKSSMEKPEVTWNSKCLDVCGICVLFLVSEKKLHNERKIIIFIYMCNMFLLLSHLLCENSGPELQYLKLLLDPIQLPSVKICF